MEKAKLLSVDPATGDLVHTVEVWDESQINAALHALQDGFQTWKKTDLSYRIKFIHKVKEGLLSRCEELAKMMAQEMGKPIQQGIGEIKKCAWLCEYYAEHIEEILEDELVDTEHHFAVVKKQPMGVFLAVMPWNYPVWQVFRAAIPCLLSGNTMLLKHASNVQGCAAVLASLFEESNCVFINAPIQAKQVDSVIKDNRIKGVTLTGSEKAGASVASMAGNCVKPSLLELGGSNAMIISSDANFESSLEMTLRGRYQNSGQSCIAVKRVLIDERHYDSFIEALLKAVEKIGFKEREGSLLSVGPMARENLAEELEKQVNESVKKGARLAFPWERDGAFVRPNVLLDVEKGMPAMDEELFGPVLAVCSYKNIEEAISLSNHNDFGLGVSIMTEKPEAWMKYLIDFEEGAVFFNQMVASHPKLPFGGVKNSGYGRELGRWGVDFYVNHQTVVVS